MTDETIINDLRAQLEGSPKSLGDWLEALSQEDKDGLTHGLGELAPEDALEFLDLIVEKVPTGSEKYPMPITRAAGYAEPDILSNPFKRNRYKDCDVLLGDWELGRDASLDLRDIVHALGAETEEIDHWEKCDECGRISRGKYHPDAERFPKNYIVQGTVRCSICFADDTEFQAKHLRSLEALRGSRLHQGAGPGIYASWGWDLVAHGYEALFPVAGEALKDALAYLKPFSNFVIVRGDHPQIWVRKTPEGEAILSRKWPAIDGSNWVEDQPYVNPRYTWEGHGWKFVVEDMGSSFLYHLRARRPDGQWMARISRQAESSSNLPALFSAAYRYIRKREDSFNHEYRNDGWMAANSAEQHAWESR